MTRSIEENAHTILRILAERPRELGEVELPANELAKVTGLSPTEINDAVAILVEAGLVQWIRVLGTAPYNFRGVWITPRGRYEYERSIQQPIPGPTAGPQVIRAPSPVGSPYGFSDEDWEFVSERKARNDILYVVLGYRFRSDYYDSDKLKTSIEKMFLEAVNEYIQLPGSSHVALDFRPLAAGYGEHLFNEIARDIIAADIAVFETSDLNPNVMLEIGVALTWGVRVLPIKKEGRATPPSDISGQTWADYRDSASTLVDPDHKRKLVRMVERAIRKKGRA